MSSWDAYLDAALLDEVRKSAIAAGLATGARLDALASAIDPLYVASVPVGAAPVDRLFLLLNDMNKVHNLRNGDVPLAQWLEGAVALAGGKPQTEIFEAALARVRSTPALRPAATVASSLAAVEDPNLDVDPEAMVAGSDETVPVGFLSSALEAAKAVVKLLVHRYEDGEPAVQAGDQPILFNGTGWLVAPGLVMTNFHVINARHRYPVEEPNANEIDLRLQAEHTEVLFDYLDKDASPPAVRTEPAALVAFDPTLDFAILRLPAIAPNVDRKSLRQRNFPIRKRPDQALGTRVNVLQHPNGDPMRLGFRDNYVVTGTKDLLTYLTDTDHGSSGSPVFDDAWTVAALHKASQALTDAEVEIRNRKVKRVNIGTPITAIMDHLEHEYPALHAEIAGAP